MRDPAGESAHRLHLLRLPELGLALAERVLGAPALGHVEELQQHHFLAVEIEARRPRHRLPLLAGAAPERAFEALGPRIGQDAGVEGLDPRPLGR